MIGAPIGGTPIGGDFNFAAPFPDPNIILAGTLDFATSYRTSNRVSTFLNFTLITNDDNSIRVVMTNNVTGVPIQLVSGEVNIYAPGTTTDPVITKIDTDVLIGNAYFQFELAHDDVADLTPGLYPWVAIVVLPDGTRHTVTCGDIYQSTGIIRVVNRPGAF